VFGVARTTTSPKTSQQLRGKSYPTNICQNVEKLKLQIINLSFVLVLILFASLQAKPRNSLGRSFIRANNAFANYVYFKI